MKKERRQSAAAGIVAAVNQAMEREVLSLATDPRFTISRVPSGSLVVDRITGGGFARGRHIELYGDESSGKSAIAYMTMALAQQRGEVCAIVDGEHVFEEDRFRFLGGDPNELVGFHPKNAEEVVQVLMLFAKNEPPVDQVKIVTVDSVPTLSTMTELAKDITEGDDRIAEQARLMSRALRRVTTLNEDTIFLWINQIRDKIGGYGSPTTTPGGRALKFYASTRLEFKRSERVKSKRKVARKTAIVEGGLVVTGHWVQVLSQKEKTTQPYREGMFYFDAERGGAIDRELEIVSLGLQDGLIQRSGNTFRYVDSAGEIFSGMESAFKRLLRENEDVREELEWCISEGSRTLGLAGEGGDGDTHE